MRRNIDITWIILIAFLAFNSFRSGTFSSPVDWVIRTLLILPGIILGLSLHEFAHAAVSNKLGDPTPRRQGRVTVNPLAHVDPLGMAALVFAGFGWGKPVMIDPGYFKHRRRDEFLVSIAGVTMNLIVAVVFSLICRLIAAVIPYGTLAYGMGLWAIIWQILTYTIFINLVLMIFNLLPIPPLDGFSILTEILNIKYTEIYDFLYRYGNFILIGAIIFGITGMIITPAVNFLYGILMQGIGF